MNRLLSSVVACLLLLGAALSAAARDWTPLSRGEALRMLESAVSSERRSALGRLAEVGVAEDVPLMLQRLWDEEEMVRGMAEQAIWGLWLRSNDSSADPMFQSGIDLMRQDRIASAIDKLNEVIAMKPEFAEVWNKRGDAYLQLGDYDRALADYGHALELNPYHFGALESCGQVWLERHDAVKAADYFRRALELNPNLWHVAMILREIEQRLENDRI